MNKSQEIEILRATVAQLGQDSYCGPWLSQQIPFIESDIRSDYPPQADYNETKYRCEIMLRSAQEERDEKVASAEKLAKVTVETAYRNAEQIRNNVASQLRKLLREIEGN